MTTIVDRVEFAKHDVMTFAVVFYIKLNFNEI